MIGIVAELEKAIEEKKKAKNKGSLKHLVLHFPGKASTKSPSKSAVVNPSLMQEQL